MSRLLLVRTMEPVALLTNGGVYDFQGTLWLMVVDAAGAIRLPNELDPDDGNLFLLILPVVNL